MGVELLEIGVKVRKGLIFTIRGCFRTVCNHPFLVGMLCFLIILYRSSPFIFQLLVSASPILVCTAVLLGTLLSFGQPNIPEIEIEEKTTIEAVLNRRGLLGDATVVEENESHLVERLSEQPELSAGKLSEIRREEDSDDTAPLIEERSRGSDASDNEERGGKRELGELRYKEKDEWIEERRNNGDAKLGEVRREEDLYDTAPLIEERSRGSEVGDEEERGGKRELSELTYKQKGEWIEESLNNGDVNGEVVDSDDEKSEADSFDSEKVNVDSLDSPPLSPWARVEEREEEEEEEEEEKESEKEQDEDEEGSDSESDCAESSSPDASMADIMPMLDELHPLLDEEGDPQTVCLSRGSSEKSLKSSASSHHSDDESESHEHLEAADDENENGEDDEEDVPGEKDEETKSAITWTEQDQKNLMDLGSSEIERNQRLENLILRRRARKSTNLFAERNLIDLESSDLPFNIAPISTRRQNPFDLPQDSYDDSGLPPIPGSAPSVMLQRRNPFDIPYDSSEEKPDLKGDVFQEEFTSSQPREPVFRRHESFNVGPSMFAPSRRQDVKMRPYFVPERTISEESSSSLFQRQSSGLSDSKASSIPETESVTSVEDTEEKKLRETDRLSEREIVELTREVTEEGPSGDPEVISQHEVDVEGMISTMEGVSEHIGHGSQSSEDEDCRELDHIEKRDHQVGQSQLEDVADSYEQGSASQYVEAQGIGNGSTSGAVESRYSRDSSSSSLSEVSERVFIDTEGEGLLIVEEPSISSQTSLGSTDQNITSTLAIDITQRAPVYDSSPRGLSKNSASSSISCDVLAESAVAIESRREIETDISRNVEVFPDSSISHSAAAVDIREHYNVDTDFAPQMSIPSTSHGEAPLDEHLVEKHVLDEASISVDDKNVHGLIEASETQLEGLPRTGSSNSIDETVEPPDSDAEIQHETDEKLISVRPSEGNTSLFYESAIQEPDFNYLNQVQASSTPVESFVNDQITRDLDMHEVQELDHYINSPSSPKFISVLPSAIETSSSRFDVQTVIEEADEIKEIDEGLLSELDNVGDFSIGQLGSGKSEFEKHVGLVGEESSSSIYHAETSSTWAAEVHSVEVNKIETFHLSEESREHMDVHEQNVECNSEMPTYQTDRAESIEVPKFGENDHDSPHQETSDEETHTITNQNHKDTLSRIPEMKIQPMENVSDLATKAELASVETEVFVADVSCPGQVDTDATSGMPETEASSIEDIDLAFKQTSTKEIEKHVVLDPPQAELQNHEDTVSAIPELEVLSIDHVHAAPEKAESISGETEIRVGVAEVSSSEMTELGASTIEDLDLAFKQISSEANEKPLVLDPVDADTPSLIPELEATKVEDSDLASKKTLSAEIEKHIVLEDTDCGTPEQEAQLAEDAHAVSKHTELTSVETEIFVAGANMSSQDRVCAEATSEITEIEASSVEEIDLVFEQIISKAMEKPVDLEAVDTDSTSGMPEIEASSVEAINQAFKHIASEEIKNRDILEPLHHELAVEETITENSGDTSLHVSTNEASVLEVGPSNDAELNDKQRTDGIEAVVNSTLPVVESKETQGGFSELHVAEAVPSEATALPPPNHVSDGETREHLKLKLDDESAKVKANDKVGTSEEKPNHEDEAVEGLHSPSSGKGKGKKLSRSSSSSSSSDSSSSDSDKD